MTKNSLKNVIIKSILHIDEFINLQLNAVLHHQIFQALESSWRGLWCLTEKTKALNNQLIKLKIISIAWSELKKDVTRAVEFDQSQLFKKIYSDEFGQAGGEPFGLLVGDYEVNYSEKFFDDDMETLSAISKICAAAFAPFISGVSPSFLGLNDFSEITRVKNFQSIFSQKEYQQWKTFQQGDESRFIGLLLPRVLIRKPYRNQYIHEALSKKENYLWTNPIYFFALSILKSFSKNHWFSGASEIENIFYHEKERKNEMPWHRHMLEVCLTSSQERLLNDLGFISFCELPYNHVSRFHSLQSVRKVKKYFAGEKDKNEKLSSFLNYLLCVSRFVHYIKVIARNKMGVFSTPEDYENFLGNWLRQYTSANSDLSETLKAKYPLREASIKVREYIGNHQSYHCVIQLCLHYQFEEIESVLKFNII